MQESQIQSLGGEDPLKKGMAPYSSSLAWEIPWTEEPGDGQGDLVCCDSWGRKELYVTERLN